MLTRSSLSLALCALAGCSDYGLYGEKTVPGAAPPDIEVSPLAARLTGICPPERTSVTAANVGDSDLTITAVEIAGAGWEAATDPLPLTLAPGETTEIRLTATGPGDATLRVSSDDPDESAVNLPLTATITDPPAVEIRAPALGAILPEGENTQVEGYVSDDADAPEDLQIAWTSDTGLLNDDPAASDGAARFTWSAADRATGDQSLTLTATDTCGLSASATVSVCQNGAYTYDGLALTSWHYEGQARWDGSNGWLQLTDTAASVVGTAFETSTTVNGEQVDISFSFFIGGGSGADGISLTALDTSRMTTYLGGNGCGIGYGGDAPCTAGPALPGWSIEVDTYYNGDGGDPTTDDHLMLTFDGDVDDLAIWAPLPEMEDTGWHLMEVSVNAPHIYVAIDGVVYFDTDLNGFTPFPAYVGFTAGTGGDTNNHLIDALEVTDYYCGD